MVVVSNHMEVVKEGEEQEWNGDIVGGME